MRAQESFFLRGVRPDGARAVQFKVELPKRIEAHACNCSICKMCGFVHVIVPRECFRLIEGEAVLSEYRFNTGVACHYFCSRCGIKSFYVPRSNPDGWSVNLNCLDLPAGLVVEQEAFDGQNWEQNAAALGHLSRR